MEGLGAVVVGIALFALLIWAGIVVNARRPKPIEATPQNLQPFLTDDELESKRISRVLLTALIASAVLALILPIYYLGEADRQASATESRIEFDLEEGEHWFVELFICANCHGADGSGGGAKFVEPRSGIETTWAAPSINDVFLRYDEEEIRYWIEFGRNGTPMPANGLEGGGSMTTQQVDQVITYLRSIQIDQADAVAQVETKVSLALDRIDRGAETLDKAIADRSAAIADIRSKPTIWNEIKDVPATIRSILSNTGTCTDESARLLGSACSDEGGDSDRDGISDSAEVQIAPLFRTWGSTADLDGYDVDFDPANAFSTSASSGEPVADLDLLNELLVELETDIINLRVTALNNAVFVETATAGLEYLEESQDAAKYEVDFDAVADEAFGGNVDDARRAVGLYEGYCARCHTAGYSAGVPFQQEAGSGAWGPSLRDGAAVSQFPDIDDHFNFVARGSEQSVGYGVNGLGRGWMPAFGFTLSRDDIMAIIAYERTL